MNNYIQVLRSGHEMEEFAPTEKNEVAKHWLRLHNAAQARLIKAVNWLTKLRKMKVDDLIRRKQNNSIKFSSEFAQSLKKIDEQFKVLERLESGEELTDEELGIEPPTARGSKASEPGPFKMVFHPDFNFPEESDSTLNTDKSKESESSHLN